MSWDLSEKIALVTGASSGIGRALAIAVAKAGAQVALVGRSEERLEAVNQEIGGNGLVLSADLTDPVQVDRVAADALSHFGRIDILLANAGLYVPGDVVDGDPDAWDEMLKVNVNSV
ncbi:MAG: SDR family NAD(P)-dependent oxidoreductase, partial [Hyphomicrobiales bacterium]